MLRKQFLLPNSSGFACSITQYLDSQSATLTTLTLTVVNYLGHHIMFLSHYIMFEVGSVRLV